jgi:hypothetical protein
MSTLLRFFAIAIALALVSTVIRAASFDPSVNFSLSGNPNGPWSYGYSQTLGGSLISHATSGSNSGLEFWNTDISIGLPWVARNSTASPMNWAGTTAFAPGALSLHPGPNGQVAILRFTAPSTGQYAINGAFFGQDYVGPTTTDVHLLLNGSSIFDGAVADFGTSHSFNITIALASGSHLDFAVGFGSNQNYLYDSTGLTATITQVPEPATLAMVGVAASLLRLSRRQKRPAA